MSISVRVKGLNYLKKGEKRFKFRTFADRIKLINASILQEKTNINLNPDETNFALEMRKCSDRDSTDDFVSLRQATNPFTRSLPQLLHNQNKIVTLLCDGLNSAGTDFPYQSFLSLISALAQDLRSEFEQTDKVIEALVNLVDPQRPELNEIIFTTLSYLFKFLGNRLVRQFFDLFEKHLHKLTNHPKRYIKEFSGESIAFLIRKANIKDLRKTVSYLIFNKSLKLDPEGVALILFCVVKSPLGNYRNGAKKYFSQIFSAFELETNAENFMSTCAVISEIARLAINHRKSCIKEKVPQNSKVTLGSIKATCKGENSIDFIKSEKRETLNDQLRVKKKHFKTKSTKNVFEVALFRKAIQNFTQFDFEKKPPVLTVDGAIEGCVPDSVLRGVLIPFGYLDFLVCYLRYKKGLFIDKKTKNNIISKTPEFLNHLFVFLPTALPLNLKQKITSTLTDFYKALFYIENDSPITKQNQDVVKEELEVPNERHQESGRTTNLYARKFVSHDYFDTEPLLQFVEFALKTFGVKKACLAASLFNAILKKIPTGTLNENSLNQLKSAQKIYTVFKKQTKGIILKRLIRIPGNSPAEILFMNLLQGLNKSKNKQRFFENKGNLVALTILSNFPPIFTPQSGELEFRKSIPGQTNTLRPLGRPQHSAVRGKIGDLILKTIKNLREFVKIPTISKTPHQIDPQNSPNSTELSTVGTKAARNPFGTISKLPRSDVNTTEYSSQSSPLKDLLDFAQKIVANLTGCVISMHGSAFFQKNAREKKAPIKWVRKNVFREAMMNRTVYERIAVLNQFISLLEENLGGFNDREMGPVVPKKAPLEEFLGKDLKAKLVHCLSENLRHDSGRLRKASLEALCGVFRAFSPTLSVESPSDGNLEVLKGMKKVYDTEISFFKKNDLRVNIESVVDSICKYAQSEQALSSEVLKAIPCYFVGLLKIPFSPIWESAVAALVTINEKGFNTDFGKHLWLIMRTEMRSLDSKLLSVTPKSKGLHETGQENNVEHFERTTDAETLYEHVFRVLEACPSLVLSFKKEYRKIFTDFIYNDYCAGGQCLLIRRTNSVLRKAHKLKILSMLKIFLSGNIFDSEQLESIFFNLLTSVNEEIQKLALECWLKMPGKGEIPNRFKKSLRNLADIKGMSSAMTLFIPQDENAHEGIELLEAESSSNQNVTGAILRILLPRSLIRKKRKKSEKANKRIFIFVSKFSKNTINLFVELIFTHFNTAKIHTKIVSFSTTNDKKMDQKVKENTKNTGNLEDLKLISGPTDYELLSLLTILNEVAKQFLDWALTMRDGILWFCIEALKLINGEKECEDKRENFARKVEGLSHSLMFRLLEANTKQESKLDVSLVRNYFHQCQQALMDKRKRNKEKSMKSFLDVIHFASQTSDRIFYSKENGIFTLLSKTLNRTPEKIKKCELTISVFQNLALNIEKYSEFENTEHVDFVAELKTILKENSENLVVGLSNRIKTLIGSKKSEKCNFRYPEKEIHLMNAIVKYVPENKNLEILTESIFHLIQKQSKIPIEDKTFLVQLITKSTEKLENRNIRKNSKTEEKFMKYWMFFSEFFSEQTTPAFRESLAVMFNRLGRILKFDPVVNEVINGLNRFVKRKLNFEVDFDAKLDAYKRLKQTPEKLTPHSVLPIVHLLFSDLSNPDFGIRSQSTLALNRLTEYFASRKSATNLEKISKTPKKSGKTKEEKSESFWPFQDYRELVEKVVVPSVLRLISDLEKDEETKICLVRVLNCLVLNFGRLFEDLGVLKNCDIEQDFFENIFNIQTHRKKRALTKLWKSVDFILAEKISKEEKVFKGFKSHTVSKILIPLAVPYAFKKTNTKDSNIQNEALKAIGKLSLFLDWKSYKRWIFAMLRILKNPSKVPRAFLTDRYPLQQSKKTPPDPVHPKMLSKSIEKTLVQVICEIVGDCKVPQLRRLPSAKRFEGGQEGAPETLKVYGFDFVPRMDALDVDEDTPEGENPRKDGVLIEEPIVSVADGSPPWEFVKRLVEAVAGNVVGRGKIVVETRKQRKKEIMGIMKRVKELIWDRKNKEMVKVRVIVAVLKLAQFLGPKEFHNEFVSLLLQVVNSLKSHSQKVRDEARFTLQKALEIGGPKYFAYLLRTMRKILRAGYQKHVLGFSIHYIVSNLAPSVPYGSLDNGVGMLTQTLLEDLLGETQGEKQVSKIQLSMKEARDSKAFSSFCTLASRIDFKITIELLINGIIEKLFEMKPNASEKDIRIVGKLLEHITKGLSNNKAIYTGDVLDYLYKIIDTRITALRDMRRDYISKTKKPIQSNTELKLKVKIDKPEAKRLIEKSGAKALQINRLNLLNHFAFDLLLKFLRKNNNHLGVFKARLKPFPSEILAKSLVSNPQDVEKETQAKILKAFGHFYAVDSICPDLRISKILLAFCFKCVVQTTDQNLLSAAFKTVSIVLENTSREELELSEKQVEVAISYVEKKLKKLSGSTEQKSQSLIFCFLTAVMKRNKPHPRFYNVMENVQKILVLSPDTSVRKKCSKSLLKFLMNYPLGEKRVNFHIEFLVSNLSYERADGRKAATGMLRAFSRKLPATVFDKFSDRIFFAVAMAVANEKNSDCEIELLKTLKMLLFYASFEKLKNYCKCVFAWLNKKKILLRCLALKIAIEVFGSKQLSLRRNVSNSETGNVIEKTFSRENLYTKRKLCFDNLKSVTFRHAIEAIQNYALAVKNNDFGDALGAFRDPLSDEEQEWKHLYLCLKLSEKIVSTASGNLQREGNRCEGVGNATKARVLFDPLRTLLKHRHYWIRSAALRVLMLLVSDYRRTLDDNKCLSVPEIIEKLLKVPEEVEESGDCVHFDGEFGKVRNKILIELCQIFLLCPPETNKGKGGGEISPKEFHSTKGGNLVFKCLKLALRAVKKATSFKRELSLDLIEDYLEAFGDKRNVISLSAEKLLDVIIYFLEEEESPTKPEDVSAVNAKKTCKILAERIKKVIGEEKYLETIRLIQVEKRREKDRKRRKRTIEKITNPQKAALDKVRARKRKNERKKRRRLEEDEGPYRKPKKKRVRYTVE